MKFFPVVWAALMALLGTYLVVYGIINPGLSDWPMSLAGGYMIATAGREFFERL